MGHLNGILARVGGNLNNNFQKSQMPGGLPGGGMLKLRFDRYITSKCTLSRDLDNLDNCRRFSSQLNSYNNQLSNFNLHYFRKWSHWKTRKLTSVQNKHYKLTIK